jgi:hypothetical protein
LSKNKDASRGVFFSYLELLAFERAVAANHRAALALGGQGLCGKNEVTGCRIGVTGLIDSHCNVVAKQNFISVWVVKRQVARVRHV